MNNDKLGYTCSVCLYFEISEEQVMELVPDSSGSANFSLPEDWSRTISHLAEVQEECNVLAVMLGDPRQGGSVRWIAVLDSMERENNATFASVSLLEELSSTLSLRELCRYSSITKGLIREPSGYPVLCEVPDAVIEYLLRNEIRPSPRRNPFLFDRCVFIHEVPDQLLHAKTGDYFSHMVAGTAQWLGLAALLAEANQDGKLLLVVFPDPVQPHSIGWLAVLREVEVGNVSTRMVYQAMFDFVQAVPRLPVSILFEDTDEQATDRSGSEPYEVCEQTWLMNDCLNALHSATTAEEFRNGC